MHISRILKNIQLSGNTKGGALICTSLRFLFPGALQSYDAVEYFFVVCCELGVSDVVALAEELESFARLYILNGRLCVTPCFDQ